MARLGDVCTINMGQSPDSATYNENGKGLPFFQGNADFGEIYPTTRLWCSEPTKVARKNDILISVRAPIGALNISNCECCIGRGLAALSVNSEICSQKYLWHALSSKVQELNSKGTGSTFKAINKKILSETEIPLPPLDEQRKIAAVLDKVSDLIAKRRQQLNKLDTLVKARFVEMFGSLDDNEKKLVVVTINEVCSLIKDGTHQTPTYTEDRQNGFKFLSAKDVMTQKISWGDIKYIPADLHEKLYATIQPRRNDILMSKNGVNYGVAAVNDTDEVFDIYVSLALLRPKVNKVNPVYFRCAINNYDTKRQFDSSIKGIGVPNLHLGEIKKTRILLPPMSQQDEFVAFIEQVDKSKLAVIQSLEKLETLKKSLMQQYFG